MVDKESSTQASIAREMIAKYPEGEYREGGNVIVIVLSS